MPPSCRVAPKPEARARLGIGRVNACNLPGPKGGLMTRWKPIALALSLFLVALCRPLLAQPAAAVAERVSADTPRATTAGTTYTLPTGWGATTKGSLVLLDLPEADSRIALVDVDAKDAKDSDAAVAAAWAAYRPDS